MQTQRSNILKFYDFQKEGKRCKGQKIGNVKKKTIEMLQHGLGNSATGGGNRIRQVGRCCDKFFERMRCWRIDVSAQLR